ncbi:MAG: NAD(P)/FAD-dependent oxidoreductase [Candidatus Thiodiazotropha sp.]
MSEKGYDAIIIGGGLGGLTSGAKLAKEGKRVLLVEQHTKPGGCATVFQRGEYTVEVSLHKTPLPTKGDAVSEILDDLGVLEQVVFLPDSEFYRFVNARVDINIPYGLEAASELLIGQFPAEEKGIRKVFALFARVLAELSKLPREKWKLALLFPLLPAICPNLVFKERATVGTFLDAVIRDEDLKMILLGNSVFYYHYDPYAMSLLMYALSQGTFFKYGGSYIRGGSQQLSDYLAEKIRRHGGEVLLGHQVTEIIVEGNRAVGVKYRKKGFSSEEINVTAACVVANAAMPNVVSQLLPDSKGSRRLIARINGQRLANSFTSVYVGTKRQLRGPGHSHSTVVFDPQVGSQADVASSHQFDFTKRSFLYTDYSSVKSQLAPDGKGMGVILVNDWLAHWEDLSPSEYRARKQLVADTLVERVERLIPGLASEIEDCEVATPKTIARYTLNPGGTPLGFANEPDQWGRHRVAQKSPVKNLYFASAWTLPCGGFGGAMMSGYTCAEEILG